MQEVLREHFDATTMIVKAEIQLMSKKPVMKAQRNR